MSAYRAVIVDDEPLARERLRTLLAPHPEWTLVAECGDGTAAVRVIAEEAPDLVFLDIQMPELNGFEVLDAIGAAAAPAIVFVTAFDEFALRAFEVSAVDYLLKPIEPARFDLALRRAGERLSRATRPDAELGRLLDYWQERRTAMTRFVVREGGTITLVRVADVDWIDAAGNYVRLHCNGREHLVRDTMKAVESRLDPAVFVRVHRSAIVNIDRVSALEPWFHGEYVVIMRDGTRLTSSRSQSRRLREVIRGGRT